MASSVAGEISKVELIDDLNHEASQAIFIEPILNRRGTRKSVLRSATMQWDMTEITCLDGFHFNRHAIESGANSGGIYTEKVRWSTSGHTRFLARQAGFDDQSFCGPCVRRRTDKVTRAGQTEFLICSLKPGACRIEPCLSTGSFSTLQNHVTTWETLMRKTRLSRLLRIAFIPAFAIGVAVSANAQTSAPKDGKASANAVQTKPDNSSYRAMRASKMIGMQVSNPEGKNLGKISDLIVNTKTGDVRYAMLEFDPGFLESEKLFAVPITALSVGADQKALLHKNMSRDKLEKAGVTKADWQKAVDNSRYLEGLDKNYGFSPPAGTARAVRASKLLGKDVNSRAGEGIGEIKELVIEMSTAKVDYAVLAFDPSWVSSEKLFAFPMTAFSMVANKDDLVLDVDKSMIAQMKSFDSTRWGSLNELNRNDFVNPAPKPKK